MNTSLAAYTPLETLLLFQSLRIYGVERSVFGRISDLLKQNRHVRSARQYDSGRLSPDALRDLYIKLVKDEARDDVDGSGTSEAIDSNIDQDANSRKRKAPSPPLPSVDEATQNPRLVPRLVEKLYVRYRAHVTEEIREEERRYIQLKQDVDDIENGKWDQRLSLEATNGQNLTPKGTAVPPNTAQNAPRDSSSKTPTATLPTEQQQKRNVAKPAGPQASPAGQRPLQPQSPMAVQTNGGPSDQPYQPPELAPSKSPASTSQVMPSAMQHAPQTRPQPSSISPAPFSKSPNIHDSTYRAQATPSGPTPSPQPPVLNPSNTQPSLAPPAGAQHPQRLQKSPYSGDGQQPFTPPPTRYAYPPPQQQPGVSQPSQGPAVPNYYAPYAPPSNQQQRLPYATPVQQVQPSQQGGRMLPPFQVNPQSVAQTNQQQLQQPRAVSTATPPPRRPSKTPASVPSRLPTQPAGPGSRLDALKLLSLTPLKSTAARAMPLSVGATPSSETRWKGVFTRTRGDRRSPEVLDERERRGSPILDLPPPPSFSLPSSKASKALKGKGARQTKDKVDQSSENPFDDDVGSIRSTRRRGRQGRGASVTSSAVDSSVRGRSQSVASHTELISVEGSSGHHVKHEPSTPAMSEDVLPGIEGVASGVGRRTRGRPPLTSTKTGKRKRDTRDASETAESEGASGTPGPHQIVAPRYFSRMSQPLMHNVTSHKYASLFSNPVKEKDAEGYRDIIRRPQDLKSIKAAISAGSKAVAAVALTETPSSNSPGAAGGNVLLSPSADVMPPKAIVNPAQLERELMRMFANAVMFNIGDEGVVRDARDMFESVQQAVSNWRSAERTGDGDDAGAEEDSIGPAKRRKM